jgi:hypothetical protein
MEFRLWDQGTQVRIPNPRTHQRLRGFVEALDRLREEPGEDQDLLLDRSVDCLRPVQHLGRVVVQKGPVTPVDLPDRAVPQGARLTADSVHHVALLRNAELVVKYLAGAAPIAGRLGYCGVFICAVDVDEAFRKAEPPTHDDWIYRAVPKGHQRSFVKIALERVAGVCREAAGFVAASRSAGGGAEISLGEFADALATLMPGMAGPGARRRPAAGAKPRRRRSAPGRTVAVEHTEGVWTQGTDGANAPTSIGDTRSDVPAQATVEDRGGLSPARKARPPQARTSGDPTPAIASDGTAVVRYPFELRGHGSRIRLRARVEVMANDGGQVEAEAPVGSVAPTLRAWSDPAGIEHLGPELEIGPEGVDGHWFLEVHLHEELMMRVDLVPELA